ncbi:hypothetical protein MPTK1_6g16720 [Marchantia polymorpha subsp. ruderalis]|uniref:Uncharacterized protein n=2 Tax=Marchantia polymorpha TaxID=3197 RepID=A0AAF6BST6_MARPO|nr:hypothetical protein MARPO_0170s0005 [Marchantia polymorpha]BBN15070.1 hypothetical protein Mp_6g16720 [Marchantia polymorpha subsp. ruderalis]|eukprot:PTQ28197.1 hypothetical protein MARPO_0170s0005 [Marchantia polymorpha]
MKLSSFQRFRQLTDRRRDEVEEIGPSKTRGRWLNEVPGGRICAARREELLGWAGLGSAETRWERMAGRGHAKCNRSSHKLVSRCSW